MVADLGRKRTGQMLLSNPPTDHRSLLFSVHFFAIFINIYTYIHTPKNSYNLILKLKKKTKKNKQKLIILDQTVVGLAGDKEAKRLVRKTRVSSKRQKESIPTAMRKHAQQAQQAIQFSTRPFCLLPSVAVGPLSSFRRSPARMHCHAAPFHIHKAKFLSFQM